MGNIIINSQLWQLVSHDWVAIAKGTCVAIGGVVLTAIAGITVPSIATAPDAKTAITIIVLSSIVNIARKYATQTQYVTSSNNF